MVSGSQQRKGAFKIISALSGKALCVKDASLEENAPIIQWTYGNNNEDTNDEVDVCTSTVIIWRKKKWQKK